MAKCMRAVLVEKFGRPEVLKVQEIPIPIISSSEVLIKIKSAGVNPVDTYIREGAYVNLPELPYIPGKDGAGIVESVGADVHKFKKEQRVFVCLRKIKKYGTYAEYTVADESDVFPLADHLSFDQGAALGIPYFTAFRALILKGKASANDRVLVHGASGAVGLATVQIAKAHNMNIIGTAGSKEGVDLVQQIGADFVFSHKDKDISKLLELTEEKKIDIIIEMLANVNLNKDLQLLATGGRVMVVGCRGSVSINPRLMMMPETQIIGVALFNTSDEEWKETSDAILKGIVDGWVNPVINRKYSLQQAADVHNDIIHSKSSKGKLVIAIDES